MLRMKFFLQLCVITSAFYVAPMAVAAPSSDACFHKSLTFRDTAITVSSSPDPSRDNSCTVQVYRLEISRNGVLIARSEEIETDWVEDARVSDMNSDDQFEILITTAGGSGGYGDLTLYTMDHGNEIVATTLPQLRKDEENGYRGGDKFAVETDRIVRTFTTYAKTDANCCPSGGKRQIEYRFTNGQLVVREDWNIFSFTLIAIGLATMFAAAGLFALAAKRRLREVQLTAVTFGLAAAAYCIAAGFYLQPGWQDLFAGADPQELANSGRTYVRRGGLIIMAFRYWPYVLIGLGSCFGYRFVQILRMLIGQRQKLR